MDFLNKAIAQLTDLLRSMTPGGRITAGLLLAVVVAGLGYTFEHRVVEARDYLFDGESIPAESLATIQVAFGKANLTNYTIEGSQIKVPHGHRADYMAALAEYRALPSSFHPICDVPNGMYNGFGPTAASQLKYTRNLEKELSLIIGSMAGVETASVACDTTVQPGLNSINTKIACVTVRPSGAAQIDSDLASKIRYLIAGSIAGMKPEKITIAALK